MNLTSPAEWKRLRRRAGSSAFRASVNRLRTEVAEFLKARAHVPDLPGGYYHDYFCPEHARELVFEWQSPQEHRCPVDGQVFSGPQLEAAWRWTVNHRLAEAALRLAVLWRISGEAHLLATAGQILRDYAGRYEGYRGGIHHDPNPGIATYTTLDESVWIIPLAWAFDAIRAALPPEESAQIARQLFAPAAAHLREHHYSKIHNFSCWHNAAIGTIGLLLDDEDQIDFAFRSPAGQLAQLSQGVLDDGLWYEGSFSYHFYSVGAIAALARAARHRPDLDLLPNPKLRRMFAAPVHCAFPNGSLPATNDCWYFTSLLGDCCHGVDPSSDFYELANAWYGDPAFAEILHRNYARKPRDSLTALLDGTDSIPAAPAPPLHDTLLANSGYAILRPGEDSYLLLKYGPSGGWHGHPDKLSLIIPVAAPDLGTPGYSSKLFESWYRQTVSHNTVVLGHRSQPPGEGKLRCFRADGPFHVADAEIQFESTQLRRVILAREDYFLDLFFVAAPTPQTIDWVWRNAGTLSFTGETRDLPALEGEGYDHLAQPREVTIPVNTPFTWRAGQDRVRLWARPETGNQWIAAEVPGNPPEDRQSMLLARRETTATVFASVFHRYRGPARVLAVDWIPTGLGCAVRTAGGVERWVIQSPGAPTPSGPCDFVYEL
ncbi:MAG: heparinase II/III family protein [Opitutaceae bacterium]